MFSMVVKYYFEYMYIYIYIFMKRICCNFMLHAWEWSRYCIVWWILHDHWISAGDQIPLGEMVALGIRIVQGWWVGAARTWIMTPSLVYIKYQKTWRLEVQKILFLHYGPGCKPSRILEALKAVEWAPYQSKSCFAFVSHHLHFTLDHTCLCDSKKYCCRCWAA